MSPTRRDFLKTSVGAATLMSLGAGIPAWLRRAATAAEHSGGAGETVLIVVQLKGGNDGLNSVVPYADDEYAKNRPTLRLEAGELHKLDSQFGFHPQMEAFARLFKEGHLGVVHGVGYPNPSGDHDTAMRAWQSAMPTVPECETGWLGRVVDRYHEEAACKVPALFVGQIARPFTLNAEKAIVPTVRSLDDYILQSLPGPDSQAQRACLEKLSAMGTVNRDQPLLDFLRRSTQAACIDSRKIDAIIRDQPAADATEYPRYGLAQKLRTVAQLMRANLGIRIYCPELGGDGFGGFDNHANQRGNHGALLRQLSESVAAFVDDLARDKLLDRVLLMTISEFGRTVKENGRRGTDHGSAAPLFLAGGKLKGGFTGDHPNLTELENGGQKHHTDFRRVYATALDAWLGVDSQSVLGEKFEPLDILHV
jgi:uncharacterized protein (DUF1501 family)